jgi:predicted double-glycine peptidase
MTYVLPVPFVSQLGAGADDHGNDCGAACVLMLLRAYACAGSSVLTVNQVYDGMNKTDDIFLSAGDLLSYMSARGLSTDWRSNMDISNIFADLVNGRPSISLIWYKPLVDAGLTEKKNFTGSHFVVTVGIDGRDVYILDPYTTAGNPVAIPHPIWIKAWTGYDWQKMPICGALIPLTSVLEIPETIPDENKPRPGSYICTSATLTVRDIPAEVGFRLTGFLVKNQRVLVLGFAGTNYEWANIEKPAGWVRASYLKRGI